MQCTNAKLNSNYKLLEVRLRVKAVDVKILVSCILIICKTADCPLCE